MITLEYAQINVQLQVILLKVILFLTFKWKLYTYKLKFYCQFIYSPQSLTELDYMPLKHLYSYAVEFKVLVRENHRIVFMTNKRVQDEWQGQQKTFASFHVLWM